MTTAFRPASDWIWVEIDEGQIAGETKTDTGIILTGDNTKPNGLVKGTVMGVGPGKYSSNGVLIPMQAKVGERVMFTKTIALQNKIVHEDKEYILVRDESIMAVI